ncbi:MAG: sigma 54-interacting transcriptional regulator [Desulfohalobiaceae bacterium]|nr:sigma 54-interacting transcriptional regulator [Desulfohalobiaceae bacterium]
MKKSILYIDDDRMSRQVIGTYLEDLGYAVFLAESGEKGLEYFHDNNPDVLLLDLRMPGMHGFEVLKRIRKQDSEIPILVISGIGEMKDVIRALRLGATNYVIKSLEDLGVLEKAVKAAFDNLDLVREKRLYQEQLTLTLEEKERYQKQLESIFNSIPDGLITIDARGCVLDYNQAMESLCPLGRKLKLNHPIAGQEAKIPEDCCFGILEQCRMKNRQVLNRRIECSYSKTDQKVILVTASPLRNKNDQLTGVTMIIKDITREQELEEQIQNRRRFKNIVGKSHKMQRIYTLIRQLSTVDSTVLILGESGTGKENVMDALHYTGIRASGPLCKVNCSALSEDLLDSELFGHVKGAFTGAHKDKIGRFEASHGGSIFLDEIGEISHRIQLKLLRVLENKSFERVGSSQTIKVDCRIISATNVDLAQKVKEGTFREDLYYRLKVLTISLPPLRERKEDIPLLVDHFCRHFSQEFQKEVFGVSNAVMNVLMRYDWPGNIRELKHTLEHGCLLSPGGLIKMDHLPLELLDFSGSHGLGLGTKKPRELTREHIEQALTQAEGNKSKAAQILGCHRKTLYRKIDQFGLSL